jgi:hypothetical protein
MPWLPPGLGAGFHRIYREVGHPVLKRMTVEFHYSIP